MYNYRIQRSEFWLWFLFIVFFGAGCDSVVMNTPEEDIMAEPGSDVAYDILMTYTDGADRVLTLEAAELHRMENSPAKDVFPKGILITFFQEDGTRFATLVSDYAERLSDDYLVIASDNVVFENIRGEKLETSQLNWDEKKEKIFTNRFAKLTRPDEIIYGYGFTANQDFTEIEFEKTTGKRPVPMPEDALH